MKSLYEKAFSAITKIIDKQIDAYEDQKDAAIKALEAERDARKEAIEQQKEQLQEQIDSIEKQISLKQEEIDAINDANKAKETEINLEKERYNLMRLMNQRTNLVYKGGQMVYMADEAAIKDQQQKVQESEDQVRINKIEQEITVLEKRKSVLEEQQDALDKQLEKIDEYYDKLIAQTEASFDALINGLEEYKSRWEELAEIEEQAEMEAILEQLGITTEDVLSMSGDTFENVKLKYLECLRSIYDGNDDMLNALSKVTGVGMDGISGHIEKTQNYIDGLDKIDFTNLSTALQDLGGDFGTVADAAKDATSAISGTGGASTGSKTSGKTTSAGAGKGKSGESGASSGNADSFYGAISSGAEEAKEDLKEISGAFAGEEEGSVLNAIDTVITKIGKSTEEEEAESDSFVGTIEQAKVSGSEDLTELGGAFDSLQENIQGVIDKVGELIAKIGEAAAALSSLESGVASINTSGGGGSSVRHTAVFQKDGTMGKAFAVGTQGLKHDEELAVRSEFYQPELTIYPDGTAELTNSPTAGFLPKDTIVFNERQTRKLLNNKGQVLGNAYATGTGANENGVMYALFSHAVFDKSKFDAAMKNNMNYQVFDSINTHVGSIDTKTAEIARNISHVKNDSNNIIDVTIGDIHLHEVQKVDGLADAIHRRLPSMVMQRLNK